jgi:hypothetical protein
VASGQLTYERLSCAFSNRFITAEAGLMRIASFWMERRTAKVLFVFGETESGFQSIAGTLVWH